MRILLANKAMTLLGGSEAYLITVGEQLQRLGHDVVAYAPEHGEAAQCARDRGLRLVSGLGELPDEVEGVLAQDTIVAYQLAAAYPKAVRLYVAHSYYWEQHRPPQIRDVCHGIVTLNDYVMRFCEAHAEHPRLVRLHQPINTTRFSPAVRRERPKRVLAFGNYWAGSRYRTLVDACDAAGLQLEHVGLNGRTSTTPELEIAEADIVVGVGRCILEAMACGRAAYVYGIGGGDGWVTPESYAAMEADGFAGHATDTVVNTERLRRDLANFDPGMGQANRDIAWRHHRAGRHATELVALLRATQSNPAPDQAPLEEMARLVRVQWEAEMRARQLAGKVSGLLNERDGVVDERDRWRAEYERTAGRLRELHDAYNRLLATRRWRLAQAIGKPLDRIRALVERLRTRRR